MGAHDVARIGFRVRGEADQQRFVGGDVVEHAGKEQRLARGGADVAGSDAGCSQETTQPFRVRRNKAKRLYCQGFCAFRDALIAGFSMVPFAFP